MEQEDWVTNVMDCGGRVIRSFHHTEEPTITTYNDGITHWPEYSTNVMDTNLSDRTMRDILDYIKKNCSQVPTFEHRCHNCGGTLELKEDEHIFRCPYCCSCYAIGYEQING